MKVKCTRDYLLDKTKTIFSEGKVYDAESDVNGLSVTNDLGVKHIIRKTNDSQFFDRYFGWYEK